MVDINKPWYIKITKNNYDILNKWWLETIPSSLSYKSGICGKYAILNRLVQGKTEGPTKGTWGDFGDEITLNDFKKYILKDYTQIYELW